MGRRMRSALTDGQTFNFYETGRQRMFNSSGARALSQVRAHPGLDLPRADAQPAA